MDFGDLLFSDNTQSDRQETGMSISIGVVKKNWDKDHQGMVQVELIMGEKGKKTTGWIRVMQPYTGNSYGNYFLPEVGTEVVIGFINGDVNEGIVLGCLWNNVDKIPANTANDKNSQKLIQTKGGHKILFDETKDKEKIQIQTKKEMDITLDDKDNKITVKDQKGENSIEIDGKNGKITLKAKKQISLNVNGKDVLVIGDSGKKASIKAGTVEINASQKLDVQGSSTSIQGNSIKLSSKGNCNVESKAMMQIKGAMVKLN